MIVFERGDLVGGNTDLLKKIDCALVERRAEAEQTALPCPSHDRCMPLPWCVSLPVQVMKAFALPEARLIGDEKFRSVDLQSNRVGCVGLQLDSVRPGLRSRIYDRQ